MNQCKCIPYLLFVLVLSSSPISSNVKPSNVNSSNVISSNAIGQETTIELGDTSFSRTLLNVGAGETMVSAIDFNLDGHQDIIVSNYADNNIVTYQGDGKGSLIKVSQNSAGERPTDMSVADINGDGAIDVVVANHETSYLTLLYGDGKGSFKPAPHSPISINVKPHPHVVQLKDLDGDNKVDLLVDNRTNNGLLVLMGLGNGQFEKQGQVIDAGGDPYLGFATGDINGDGKLDIVTPNQSEIGIALRTNSEKLSFSLKKMVQFESPFAVELADMSDDGKVDLIVASAKGLITIIPGNGNGNGNGNFIEKNKTIIKTSSGAKQIAIGDINGDGIKDSLISNWSGDLLVVLGGKATFETISFKDKNIPNPWGIVLVDLNEDGKSDFIVASGDSQLAAVYMSETK